VSSSVNQDVSVSVNNGDWTMRWSNNSERIDAKAHGTVVFNDDLSDVQSISDGGYFTLRVRSGSSDRSVELRSSGGTLSRTYSVGGSPRAWDDEARRWLASELPRLVRRSGLGAESRVKSILQKKGVSGVLDEIALLESDYVRRIYFVRLLENARLDHSSVLPVLHLAGQRIASDYDRGQVLQQAARQVALDRRAAQAYVEAMATMKSDYERRRTLTALFKSAAPAAQSDDTMAAIASIKSNYDKRLVLTELMMLGPMSTDAKKALLRETAAMGSDYDRGQVLVTYVKAYGVESGVRDLFFVAVKAMASDYERRRVLTDVAKRGATAADVQTGAFGVVQSMQSDYDRAEILLAFLSTGAVASSTRAAFVSAAETIRSQHDQNRVLAALVRSEGR
jgi:hypothetical protein